MRGDSPLRDTNANVPTRVAARVIPSGEMFGARRSDSGQDPTLIDEAATRSSGRQRTIDACANRGAGLCAEGGDGRGEGSESLRRICSIAGNPAVVNAASLLRRTDIDNVPRAPSFGIVAPVLPEQTIQDLARFYTR